MFGDFLRCWTSWVLVSWYFRKSHWHTWKKKMQEWSIISGCRRNKLKSFCDSSHKFWSICDIPCPHWRRCDIISLQLIMFLMIIESSGSLLFTLLFLFFAIYTYFHSHLSFFFTSTFSIHFLVFLAMTTVFTYQVVELHKFVCHITPNFFI